jgi:CDP-paratose 2-epimerase
MSTNKVYGDRPNGIAMRELATRFEYDDPAFEHGIPEHLSIDQSTHSLMGASKTSADIMVQEYGRYFNMPSCCLRGGCLTGPNHSGVELHGFLSYLIKCNLEEREYKVFGYQGQAGSGQHPLGRRGAFYVRILEGATGCRSLQSGRRQGQRLLHS